jgi:hypothetical protein
MRYVVHYLLKSSQVEHDRARLEEVYAELASWRPGWLRCQSFRLSDHASNLLLIDTDDMARLPELPDLFRYLKTLALRCVTDPRASVVEERVDVDDAVELGRWDPDRLDAAGP